MIKIKPGTQIKFVCISFFYCLFPLIIKGQDTESRPWDYDPKSYVRNLATLASKEQILVQDQIKNSNTVIDDLNSKILNTKDTNLRKQLMEDLKSKKNELTTLQTNLKSKISISKQYKSLLSQSPAEIKKYFNNEYSRTAKINSPSSPASIPAEPAVTINSSKEVPNTNAIKPPSPKPVSTDYKFEKWISKNVIKSECAFQTVHDPSRNAAVEPELLFAYTPEEIKKALRGLSYIKGFAFVGKEPGYTYFQLNIEIASDLALQHYGNLHKSFMLIKLLNGKEIRLINSRFDTGKSDPVKKTTSLSGIYYLDKEDEKSLSGSELDKIRLNFVSGYEDYVIYNVDFFTRQLACINAIK